MGASELRSHRPVLAAAAYGSFFLLAGLSLYSLALPTVWWLALTLALIVPAAHGLVEPLAAYLRTKPTRTLAALAEEAGYRVPVRLSRGASFYSAVAVGFLPSLRFILVKENAVEAVPREQLRALLAHEAAHFTQRHVWKHTLLGMAIVSGTSFLSTSIPLLLAWIVLGGIVFLYWTRRFETSATRLAMSRVGALAYLNAMQALDATSNRKGHFLARWWYRFTHPPEEELRRVAARSPEG